MTVDSLSVLLAGEVSVLREGEKISTAVSSSMCLYVCVTNRSR